MAARGTAVILLCFAVIASAQDPLPEAPAKKTVESVCGGCHDLDTAIGERHDKAGWQTVIATMVNRGARASDQEFDAIVDYLAKYFGVVNVNKASAKEIEDGLGISTEQSAAIVRYRGANGEFKDLEGLKKVPGLDAKLLEDRKDRITFK
ncbi:MAG TPA: helix-hairpin-helix domain-containing protein [Bryobacteraceae bacterium]|jgi:competence protein ComEA|nr:helix-hairpin-helix domain-containing protein [Bryobacteraceae bacterium]